MIPYSKVYIDYKRYKDIATRRIISVTKYSDDLYRAYIESETSLGYLVWVAKEEYKGTLYLRYACECTHFKISILPPARNKFATIKINGDYAILVDEWTNLDKHAYVAASKLLDVKIPVALPLDQLIDFALIEAQQEVPELDDRVKEFKSSAKRLLESIDLIELQKDVFVAFDNELKLH
jgi:hypothetical protein